MSVQETLARIDESFHDIETFKTNQGAKLDELRERLDQFELRENRRGLARL